MKITWNKKTTPEEMIPAMQLLGEDYDIAEGSGGDIAVSFARGLNNDSCVLTSSEKGFHIEYGSLSLAMRAIGTVIAEVPFEGRVHTESRSFSRLGIMLDCSRNAVMRPAHFKKWLRRMALMGYNEAMLYTEDTYTLPGEDFFGYMRGAYTLQEMQEVDNYASKLGIEMIACIQTLGHLAQMLRWPAYSGVKDTKNVILVDEPKTYMLIGKMLDFWAKAFKSRRIHIGMDETHDLGRGKFMDAHGYERGFEIFNRHLQKVVEMSEAKAFSPMIWSDMYFRMGSKTMNYYDPECMIPPDVIEKIPAGVNLVYWDYYHDDPDFYLEWIDRHRALGSEPIVASGIWTWTRSRLWHDRELTEATIVPCVDACRKKGIAEIIFTIWGDNGASCDIGSALSGLAFAAEKCFDGGMSHLKDRFSAICLTDYDINQIPNALNSRIGADVRAAPILWDDPIYNIYLRNRIAEPNDTLDIFVSGLLKMITELENTDRGNAESGNLEHALLLAKTLCEKIRFATTLCSGYRNLSPEELSTLKAKAEVLIQYYSDLLESFRCVWLKVYKPFGLDVIQKRLAGVIERYKEIGRQLTDFIEGNIDKIEELEVETPAYQSELSMNYAEIAYSSSQ